MNKGLTYLELMVVLGIVPIIIAIFLTSLGGQNYFYKTRDAQRIKDLSLLNNALNFYFQNATTVDPDGPNLNQRGVDESLPTIFVSVPIENYKFFESCFYYPTGKVYYIYQTSKSSYQNINGIGWLPVNFNEISYQSLSYLPVDPVNSLNSGLYYLYAFERKTLRYELSAKLESKDFQKGGQLDKVSTDGGNDLYRLEIGTNLEIIPPFISGSL